MLDNAQLQQHMCHHLLFDAVHHGYLYTPSTNHIKITIKISINEVKKQPYVPGNKQSPQGFIFIY